MIEKSKVVLRNGVAVPGFLFYNSRENLLRGVPSVIPTYNRSELSPYRHFENVRENEELDRSGRQGRHGPKGLWVPSLQGLLAIRKDFYVLAGLFCSKNNMDFRPRIHLTFAREHLSGQANHQYRLWSLLMWEMWRERWHLK